LARRGEKDRTERGVDGRRGLYVIKVREGQREARARGKRNRSERVSRTKRVRVARSCATGGRGDEKEMEDFVHQPNKTGGEGPFRMQGSLHRVRRGDQCKIKKEFVVRFERKRGRLKPGVGGNTYRSRNNKRAP